MRTSKKRQKPLPFGCTFENHQSWISWLHDVLPKPDLPPHAPVVLDLFAGCGGLALGFEAEGFRTLGFEMQPVPVETYNTNLVGHCEEIVLTIGIPEGKADIIIVALPASRSANSATNAATMTGETGFRYSLMPLSASGPKLRLLRMFADFYFVIRIIFATPFVS